jgi:chromosome segregation ATPase
VATSVLLRTVSLAEHPENFTYTAAEAARILRLSSQRVRQLLASGELRGVRDEVGHWEVDVRSVHALLNERREAFSEALEDLLRLSELEAEVRELRYLLGRAEGRLELAKGAESALRTEREKLVEELTRQRERADRLEGAQEEAQHLRAELEAERSKGFWRRLFGG